MSTTAVNELSTRDKLALIAGWSRRERQDACVFGSLFLVGLVLTVFAKHIPQLATLTNAESVKLALGGATLPMAAQQLWKRVNSLRVLSFLQEAYSTNVAIAHADTVFARRLEQFSEKPS